MINAGLMTSVSGDWNTPESVLKLVRRFDAIRLDPRSNGGSIVGAKVEWSEEVNGLGQSWAIRGRGVVYVNPPYGRTIIEWARKIRREADAGVEVVALLPARTDARWWQQGEAFESAAAVCFWRGRITFCCAPASAPFPSAVVYWGPRALRFQRIFATAGMVVLL